jgi:hypothetical protein
MILTCGGMSSGFACARNYRHAQRLTGIVFHVRAAFRIFPTVLCVSLVFALGTTLVNRNPVLAVKHLARYEPRGLVLGPVPVDGGIVVVVSVLAGHLDFSFAGGRKNTCRGRTNQQGAISLTVHATDSLSRGIKKPTMLAHRGSPRDGPRNGRWLTQTLRANSSK